MSTSPVTLDFTKAQPISSAPAATANNAGVQLDFSKAVPINPPASSAPSDSGVLSFLPTDTEQNANQNRAEMLSGLTGMPAPGQNQQQFQKGKAAGTVSGLATAGAVAAAPFVADAAGLGSEYAEYAGQRILEFTESQLQQFAEAYPHLAKLAAHFGLTAGGAGSALGAYKLWQKLTQ